RTIRRWRTCYAGRTTGIDGTVVHRHRAAGEDRRRADETVGRRADRAGTAVGAAGEVACHARLLRCRRCLDPAGVARTAVAWRRSTASPVRGFRHVPWCALVWCGW